MKLSGTVRTNASPKSKKTGWDALRQDQREALPLLAEDKLSDERIAQIVGVAPRTLWRWKNNANFQMALTAEIADYSTRVKGRQYAEMFRRVEALNGMARRIERVWDARANDPELANVPGGKEGIVVKQIKSVGYGHDARIVEEYAIDTGSIKEWRGLLDQTRDELGQKTEKLDLTVTKMVREYIGVDPDAI